MDLPQKNFKQQMIFAHMWSSALAHCQKRFEGKSQQYKQGPSGGLVV